MYRVDLKSLSMPRKAAKELRIWSHCVDGRRMVHNSRVYGMYDPEWPGKVILHYRVGFDPSNFNFG